MAGLDIPVSLREGFRALPHWFNLRGYAMFFDKAGHILIQATDVHFFLPSPLSCGFSLASKLTRWPWA